jgi:hypothetical protein
MKTVDGFSRVASLVLVVLVALVGGVVVIVHPTTLSFAAYIRDLAVGFGLLGIGLGIDSHSRP